MIIQNQRNKEREKKGDTQLEKQTGIFDRIQLWFPK